MREPLVTLLRRAALTAERLAAEDLLSLGITPIQLLLLRAIRDNPMASQRGLVQCTGIDRSTMSKMIQKLLQQGLISRVDDPKDGRRWRVCLMASGDTIVREAEKICAKTEKKIMAEIPVEQIRAWVGP